MFHNTREKKSKGFTNPLFLTNFAAAHVRKKKKERGVKKNLLLPTMTLKNEFDTCNEMRLGHLARRRTNASLTSTRNDESRG